MPVIRLTALGDVIFSQTANDLVIRPHRSNSYRPRCDVAEMPVCLSVRHVREPCKNGLTDRDADCGVDSSGQCPNPQWEWATFVFFSAS